MAMLTALLLAMTSLVTLLAMLTFSTLLLNRVITQFEGSSDNHGNNIVNTESNQQEVYRPGNAGCNGAPSTTKGPSVISTFTCMLVILVDSLEIPVFEAAPSRSQTNDEWHLPGSPSISAFNVENKSGYVHASTMRCSFPPYRFLC